MNSNAALTLLTKELKRLERAGNYRALKTYLGSPECRKLMAALNADGMTKALGAMGRTQAALTPQAPLPSRWSMRVRWTPELIAALRQADARYGEDRAIARALGIPFANAKRARARYVGSRAAGTPANMHQR